MPEHCLISNKELHQKGPFIDSFVLNQSTFFSWITQSFISKLFNVSQSTKHEFHSALKLKLFNASPKWHICHILRSSFSELIIDKTTFLLSRPLEKKSKILYPKLSAVLNNNEKYGGKKVNILVTPKGVKKAF